MPAFDTNTGMQLADLTPASDAETLTVSRARSHLDSSLPECRICLQSGAQPGVALIEGFCACSGTVKFAHESCIVAWAKEKWSLR